MNDARLPTFETLLQIAQETPVPGTDDKRKVTWCDRDAAIGLAKQCDGSIEIFIRGEQLVPISTLVRRHLRFDQWARSDGAHFAANRLVFPAEPYFVAVTAFLAEELVRAGIAAAPLRAFRETEPLIEMALRRVALGEDEILGLLGELRFLEILLSVPTWRSKSYVLGSWRGFEKSERDFVLDANSIEIKATRGHASRHPVSSVGQVDPRRSDKGTPIESLHLVSMGFAAVEKADDQSRPLSLPLQVDAVLSLLATKDSPDDTHTLQSEFLDKVASYGGTIDRTYRHAEMHSWAVYQDAWQHRFLRIYDMTDPNIGVLRHADIAAHAHVDGGSVTFTIELPDKITGDLNPETDCFAFAKRLLG